ncbi:hypothetical protein [Rhizobium lusitanum]|uniref:Phage tail repeat like n=1 Tax=Rhizobium lusitanum TaxID=293958 RepID=A0A1C3WMM8_9HYPH|nr:hypothetical protein [Rhizobium lusitanum]SCB41220.1 Phage tail repeat like [Rhizobium lusitanum]
MRRLNQYQIRVGDDLGDPDYWNRRFEDVDLRLHGQEEIEKDWRSAVRELQENGLRRIDEAVSPLIAQLQEDLQLGAVFIAESKSAIEVKTGPLTIGISSANKRRYSPAAYLALVTRDAPYGVMLGRLISYNRDTGSLAVDIERTFGAGDPIRANWIISATSHIDYQADRVYREAGGGLTSTTVEDALREVLSLTVPKTRSVTAGTGLKGGGEMVSDLSMSLDLAYTDVRYVKAQDYDRHRHLWSEIDNKPTTLGGYGIGDAHTKAEIFNLLTGKQDKLSYNAEDKANKGKPDGYAPLGPDGKIAGAFLPVDGSFLGVYNAETNTPAISSGSGNQGDFWVVSIAGYVVADDIGAVAAGDQLRRGPSRWELVPTFNAVSSVAGKTGVITLNAGDISDSGATGRAILKAGDAAAAKAALSLAVADLSDFSTAWTAAYDGVTSAYGRALVAAVDANAARVSLQLGSAALQASTAFAAAAHVGAGGVGAHPDATATTSGFMSAADKTKLGGVAAGANNYVHPTGDGNLHVPSTGIGSSKKVLTAGGAAGSMTWSFVDFADVAGKPATLSGYGIADAYSTATIDALLAAKQASLGYVAENIANKGAANGYASLDGGGKIPASQLPASAITDTFVVATQAAMLALGVQKGDVAIRTDVNKSFILQAEPATTLANWQELRTPTDVVQSVAGRQGAVTLTSADLTDASAPGRALLTAANNAAQRTALGLGNVNDTSDAAKPVSNAMQAALNQKSDTGHKHAIADIANLQTTLDTKQAALGYAPVNRAGDLMTGSLEIKQDEPSFWLHRPNVKRGRFGIDSTGTLFWMDQSGQAHFYVTSGGVVWTQQLGDLNQRIEDRANYWGAAHGANCVTDARAAGYIEVAVKTGSSGGGDSNNGGYFLCRAYKSGVEQLTFGSRQLQLYIQNRGWFAAFAF